MILLRPTDATGLASRRVMPGLVLAGVAVLLMPALACTAARLETPRITADALLADREVTPPGAGSSIVPANDEILAVSSPMRMFLEAHVDSGASPERKLRQLISAIIDSSAFGLEYDDRTRTAAETFRLRRGNCLSFSTMFVAMARHVGLHAEYQEVDIPPDWTLDRETYVLNRHVNVFVDLGTAGTRVVDFNIADFKTTYDLRRIPDERALAHHFNNLGVERMQEGDREGALACFQRAISDGDRRFSSAWTNLGTLQLRKGDFVRAEAAYLHALNASPDDLVAMSNLARLYERAGDRARVAEYRNRVALHRRLNPYYRYELARRAYGARSYDEAIGHLLYANRKRPKEDEFCFLLGLSFLQKGNAREARRWLTRAEQVAATDALKRRYSAKIEILLRDDHP